MNSILKKSLRITLSTLLFSIIYFCSQAFANPGFETDEPEFLPVDQAYQVRAEIRDGKVLFHWDVEDAYYMYRHKFALSATSPSGKKKLDITLPDGKKKFDEAFDKELEVYYHSVTVTAVLPKFEGNYEFTLRSQGCADAGLCYPPRALHFSVNGDTILAIDEPQIQVDPRIDNAESDAEAAGSAEEAPFLPFMLIGALIGGMILNLMPCVFPVLSLKALSLASGDPATHRINGWAYTAGVVISFVLVAVIIIVAKNAGTTLGWGFQLQQPIFVAALAYLFFLLGMNLFGMFEIGTSWMGVGQKLTQGNGLGASFFTGVLAAVVASPCTAPFMATAIGFTITQNAFVALSVFVSLGFGMALPYLLLSHSPAIASRLPRPGAWMDTFKQGLAFPLFITSTWLLIVLGEQTSADAAVMLVGGAIALTLALWLIKKQPNSFWKWPVRAFALASLLTAANIAKNVEHYGQETSLWQDYSAELLSSLREEQKPVFVDFTADWCITCKINERVALDTDSIMTFAKENNITMLRGDWTRSDPKITKILREFKRNGVPLYLMYPAGSVSSPEVLPQILTQSIVLESMQNAVK